MPKDGWARAWNTVGEVLEQLRTRNNVTGVGFFAGLTPGELFAISEPCGPQSLRKAPDRQGTDQPH